MNQHNRWQRVDRVNGLLLASLLLTLALVLVAQHLPAHAAGNTLTLDRVTASAGTSGTFAITLENSDAIASGQVRFTYATSLGLTITGVQVTDRTSGFTSTGSAYNTTNATLAGYQVLFYNLSNLTIAPGTGTILSISYTLTMDANGETALPITQAILANPGAQALPVTTVDGFFTATSATATPTVTSIATNTELPPTSTESATATPVPVDVTNTPLPPVLLPNQLYLPLVQR